MNGSQITGFAAYKIKGDEVTDITMFAFNTAKGAGDTLLDDMTELISNLLGSHRKVSWSAVKENKANTVYQRLIANYDANPDEYTTKIVNEDIIYYSIENKNISERQSHRQSQMTMTTTGIVPNIDTFAIFTAENPNSAQLQSKENQDINETLEQQLSNKHYGYRKVKRKYGNSENTYFIPNITKNDALFFGTDWKQNTIIFAEKINKEENGKSYSGMKIDMIWTFPEEKYGDVEGTRYVFINDNDRNDYYSIVKGRRFYIPFFDDENEVKNEKGETVGTNVTGYEKAYWNGSKINEVQHHYKLSDIEEINNNIKESLNESKIEKYRWQHRGLIRNKINKLNYGWYSSGIFADKHIKLHQK
jgi:hypothetical protein